MNGSFAEYVASVHADRDAIQQCFRHYILEKESIPTAARMRSRVADALVESQEFDSAIARLGTDSAAIEEIAILYLNSEWQDGHVEKIKNAMASAKAKAPVVETAI